MKKSLFLCDIDNTLIYSLKHEHTGWPCVEWIHEKEQAYMQPRTLSLLREIRAAACFVAVTSRSAEQYARIRFPEGCEPEMAVTANGAGLMTPGGPDAEWQAESERLLALWQEELQRMETALFDPVRFIRCRIVDGAYLFVYCGKETDPARTVAEIRRMTALRVMAGGKKIYLMPPPLNKGEAVNRLRARIGAAHCVAAGDSAFDLPMLDAADCAVMPRALEGLCRAKTCRICPDGRLFSEFVTETVRDML